MNFFMTNNNLPNFIKREIEQLHKIVTPLMKKVSKYSLWTFPLITISLFNLFFLLFITPQNEYTMLSIAIYALIGALGMALSKEAKIHQREVHKVGSDYMVERINKSEIVSENRKKEYIALIKEQPLRKLTHFIEFLSEEDNKAKRAYFN
jgi:nucleoid-associated protein YejK